MSQILSSYFIAKMVPFFVDFSTTVIVAILMMIERKLQEPKKGSTSESTRAENGLIFGGKLRGLEV